MARSNDIVLIDSDDEDQSRKRVKLDTPEILEFGPPFRENLHTPDHIDDSILNETISNADTYYSSSDSFRPPMEFSLRVPVTSRLNDSLAQEPNDDDDDDEDDDDESESEDEVLNTNPLEINSFQEDLPSDSDLSVDQLSISEVPNIPKETIIETRAYLKKYGNLKFLEKYLPTNSTSDDILNLIFQLGFVPKIYNWTMQDLISTLNKAMIKIRTTRDRLDSVTTPSHAIDLIEKSSKILVITGAGISTSVGIPDFRSLEGFYSQIKHLGLNDPQEVFDLENFLMDPLIFYFIAHMIIPPKKIFSPLHAFIKLLQDKGKLLKNYTQNIDNLESYAGIKPEKLVQCHGSFATATCITCKFKVSGETIFEDIKKQVIPNCPKCAKAKKRLQNSENSYVPESFGVFKPDITFFGEALPEKFHDQILNDLNECDLLISIGTSLKVAPVADIVDKVADHVPQILINRDPISHCNFDVSLLGYCDEVSSYIANKLGESWSIDHEKYNEIRGKNGDNLKIEVVNESLREYRISRADEPDSNTDAIVAPES